jgi:hypothetical protein
MNQLLLSIAVSFVASQAPARNVVIVTIDGMRPDELFEGAQRELMRGVEDEGGLVAKYWRDDREERRRALLPFLWNTVAQSGQLFGNAALDSPMQVTNAQRCSYPGYAELFTGWADPRITGNGYGPNPNVTLLEWLDGQAGFEGRVQVFATWDTFFRIFNVERSRLDVRAGWTPPFASVRERTPTRDALDSLFRSATPVFGGNALDAPVFTALKESLRTEKPRLLFLGLGEVDEWMHAGRYDLALEAAHREDAMIAELWALLQSLPEYRGNTTLIITTDHGRGQGRWWREHGASLEGSQNVWLGILGAGVPALGERRATGLVTQAQVASTIGGLLGFDWNEVRAEAGRPLPLGLRVARAP